jgi:hypothetical protein
MYRPFLIALLIALSSASSAQRSTGLIVDDERYDLLGTGRDFEVKASSSQTRSPAGAGSHGDLVRATLSEDVMIEPPLVPSTTPARDLLVPAWGKGEIPPSAKPDTAGAFRFLCEPGQVSYDDPIVFPGQPGKSHLHQWFGNTAANAASTYESLRRSGKSTCMNTLNRSAYWMPAMLDGKGSVVRPDYVSIYYKRLPKNSPECLAMARNGCTALPRGLRMIFGYDMITKRANEGGGYFNCDGPGAKSGHFATITEAAEGCPAGARLGAVITAPNCWDGKRLDSPNHRDHMANASYGSWGYLRCPSTHPFVLPAFTMGAWYSVDQSGAKSWYLASDEMPGMKRAPAGSTFHADWFGAWDDDTLAVWTANCIDKLLNCSGGDLGNGQQLRQSGSGFQWYTKTRLVPVPQRPLSELTHLEEH